MTSPYEMVTDTKLLRKDVEALKQLVETGAGGDGIPPAIINAKGDLIVGSAADVPTILPVGTNGQVLSADSSTSTGLKWIPAPSGGGTGLVSSVAGRTGDVVLTSADVGLGNVNNTSDANKPISTATQNALNAKADSSALTTHVNDINNPHSVTKAQVGLGNVDNTSDADKPVSNATQAALNLKADLVDGAVPLSQLPSAATSAGVQVWEWYVDTATQGAGVMRRYNDSGQTLTIVAIRVRANINAPAGSDIIVDLNRNGTTIFTNQANRPRIVDGTQDSGKIASMDIASVPDGAYLVPDIDQVGSTVPGSGILVSVTLR